MLLKLLYLTPHLSTGGLPQFVLKRIQELQKHKDQIEIFWLSILSLVTHMLFNEIK